MSFWACGPDDEEHEPDYRFTLANERTFLAWIRTALGLLMAGIAIHEFVPGKTPLAVGCVLLGTAVAAGSYPQWRRVQRAMRRDAPLPRSPIPAVLTVGVGAIALLAGVLVALA